MTRGELLHQISSDLRKLTKELVDDDNDAAMLAMASVSNVDAVTERLEALAIDGDEFIQTVLTPETRR